jgi:large subunit ribosomal protein L10
MLREEKEQIVAKLADKIDSSTIIIVTNYQGLPAKEMAELRSALAKMGAEYHVVKNTLAWFAADRAGKKQLTDIVEGPVALAFGYEDAVNPVKVLNQYIKSTESPLQIKGGLVGERILTPDEVMSLADLPPREILISQLINQLRIPISSLHNILNCPLQGLLVVLQGRAQKISE